MIRPLFTAHSGQSLVVALLALVLSVSLAASVAAKPLGGGQQGGRPFTVALSGPGDPDGTGTALLTLNPGQEQLCYELTVRTIAPATAAHLHVAPSGGVVVGLATPTEGSSGGCVHVDRAVILEIFRNPTAYYVNVHNAAYPAGAVQGTLG